MPPPLTPNPAEREDLETVHRLIEDEFFDLETFTSRADFLAKATLCQLYFDLARPTSHKGGLSPWQIIQQLEPQLPLRLFLFSPVLLDRFLDSKGDTLCVGIPNYNCCRKGFPAGQALGFSGKGTAERG